MLGRAGLAADDPPGADGLGTLPAETMVEDWLRGISLTIAAGTSQIQRNIVGRADPRPAQGTGAVGVPAPSPARTE